MDNSILPPSTLIICSRNRPDVLCDMVNSILRAMQVPCELIISDQSDHRHRTLRNARTEPGKLTVRARCATCGRVQPG